MKTKECTKCGMSKVLENFANSKTTKDGKNSWCKDCLKKYRKENADRLREVNKNYYNENREKRINYQKEYAVNNLEIVKKSKRKEYQKNKEKYLKRRKEYYEKNKEDILLQMKVYQQKNRKNIILYKRKYSEKNKEKIRERNSQYLKNNPEKIRERNAKKRALIRNNLVGNVDYQEILKRDGMFCYLCEKAIDDGKYHMDHVIPLSKGGVHPMENIKVTHAKCNLIKHDKSAEEAIALIKEDVAYES